jgi:hypothetical protein
MVNRLVMDSTNTWVLMVQFVSSLGVTIELVVVIYYMSAPINVH